MQAKIYRSFIRSLSSLTPRQRHNLDSALKSYDQERLQTLDQQLAAEFCEHPVCPHCQSEQVNKWGLSGGRQRFKCKSCNGTFNAFTDTP